MRIAFPAFVEELEKKSIRYLRILPFEDDPSSAAGRSWRSTYLTEDKREAELKCKALGGDCSWQPDGSMKTVSKILPAVKIEPRTQKYVWFNSIVAAFYGSKETKYVPENGVVFGDGTTFNLEVIERCQEILEENSVAFKWEKGDVLLVDNNLVLHSRKTFVPPRRILAALFQ
jgi:hypothetical protein